MLTIQGFRCDVESREIDAIDEILRGQLVKPNRIGSALPVEVNGASAAGLQPFIQSPGESRAITLMKFRQPDIRIRILKEVAKRRDVISCVFGENLSENLGA